MKKRNIHESCCLNAKYDYSMFIAYVRRQKKIKRNVGRQLIMIRARPCDVDVWAARAKAALAHAVEQGEKCVNFSKSRDLLSLLVGRYRPHASDSPLFLVISRLGGGSARRR